MHELSIVMDLVDLCEKNAKENNAKEVQIVEIKLGRLSGVEPHLLQNSFDFYKINTICHDAKLLIKIQEVVVQCDDCKFSGILSQNHFTCPKCNSNNLKVIDGEEMYLMRLTMI